eukprot:13118825-Alexandrium_andersonii.AAC.1
MVEMLSRVRELTSVRSSRDSRRHSVANSGEGQVPSVSNRPRDIPEASRSSEDLRHEELRQELGARTDTLACSRGGGPGGGASQTEDERHGCSED